MRYVKKEFPASVKNIVENGHEISQILENIKNEEQETRARRAWKGKLDVQVCIGPDEVETLTSQNVTAVPPRSRHLDTMLNSHVPSSFTPSTYPTRIASHISGPTRNKTKVSGNNRAAPALTPIPRRPGKLQEKKTKPAAGTASDQPGGSGQSPRVNGSKRETPFVARISSHPSPTFTRRAPVTCAADHVTQVSEPKPMMPKRGDRFGTGAPPAPARTQHDRSSKVVQTKAVTRGSSVVLKASTKAPWK